ncbi:hypothetical protein [Phascolarctobacterium sp.]|uniref:restriction endonuclease n=1 Tax=Phascolarctobacterium sp. TaxID=2049039 RepID=UPI003078729C
MCHAAFWSCRILQYTQTLIIAALLGTYNPDWVVLIEIDGKDKLYFVLETKADIMFDALRPLESAKIKCGRKHFEALGNEVAFDDIDSFEEFIEEQVVL